MIKKRFVKPVEYERFLHRQYLVTDFKSKSNGKKDEKEMEKYIPSHQVDIILYATFFYDEYGNYVYNDSLFKGKMFTSSLSQIKSNLKMTLKANYQI